MKLEGSEHSGPTIQGAPQGKEGSGGLEESLSDVLTNRQRLRFKASDILLDRYQILSELGQGGMGLVFRCLDKVGGVEVALKMLPPEVAHDTGEMEEVRENFQLVQKLHHPNICAIKTLECDKATGDYFLIMELAQGVSLRAWHKGRARSPSAPDGGRGATALPEILPVLRQIAAALDYAHSQKIIHRDIKPANVMIATDGGVKVLDFGLATQVHTSMSRVSHVRYGTSGTGPYMAPEQWEGQYQDARTDQYAFAVLAYELLAGRLPFENPDAMVLRNAVLHSAPKKPDGIDATTWNVLKIGLAKERDQRFASCTEFVEVLGGKKILPQRTQSSPSKKVWFGLAAAVVLALLTYPVYRAYQSSAENRAQELAQAADAARLDAQKREQAATLQREAEAALTAGELEKAGAKISELEQLVGKNSAAAKDLNTKYEAKAGERETNSRYAKASLAREAAQKIDRGEMLGAQLDELELKWCEAEAARQGKTWGQALKAYDTVLALAKTATAADVARTAAKEQQTTADDARKKAASAQAATDAAAEFATAQKEEKAAATAFGQGDFAAASKAWKKAAELFQGSENRGLAVTEAREHERQAKLDAALTMARAARDAQKWDEAVSQADAALVLDSGHAEAKRLKAEAEQNQTPSLTIVVEAEGQEVVAKIEAGGQSWIAPQSFNLTGDKRYVFNVTYPANPSNRLDTRRWQPAKLELTADWRGPQTRRVKLEAQRGPPLGRALREQLGAAVRTSSGDEGTFLQMGDAGTGLRGVCEGDQP